MTSRRWALTFWEDPREKIAADKCRYFVTCKEQCPDTGKEHWQSYIEFAKNVRMTFIKKLFDDNTVHCEPAKGDANSNRKYCLKTEGESLEIGKPGGEQGRRSDLEELKRKRDAGEMTLTDIQDAAPQLYMQYRSGWRDIEKTAQWKKAKTLGTATWEEVKCDTTDAMYKKAKEYIDAFMIEVAHDMKWDEYRGEDTIVLLGDNAWIDKAKLTNPLPMALPCRYQTTYPNWTKIVHIWVSISVPEVVPEVVPLG